MEVNSKEREEKQLLLQLVVSKEKTEVVRFKHARVMNKKCYIFKKHFFESCSPYVLPPKVVTFIRAIGINSGCHESSAV